MSETTRVEQLREYRGAHGRPFGRKDDGDEGFCRRYGSVRGQSSGNPRKRQAWDEAKRDERDGGLSCCC